jgi:hypothetical protein
MSTTAIEKVIENNARSSSERAAHLADRILLGAANLAALAESLSDEEWLLPVSASDKRSIGVIVHHVASMYPIEIDAALTISKGTEVKVTWENIAEVNAGHAAEHLSVTKTEALELLRTNSQDAAETVRQFTEAELDQAAAFGLVYGAPVTAQFVIEDHALRHSWHHLAKIRHAVGR